MGWHKRHCFGSPGLEGHLRPETLNLEAWIHAQGLQKVTANDFKNQNQKAKNIYINRNIVTM
jgi:hypothetical protein